MSVRVEYRVSAAPPDDVRRIKVEKKRSEAYAAWREANPPVWHSGTLLTFEIALWRGVVARKDGSLVLVGGHDLRVLP